MVGEVAGDVGVDADGFGDVGDNGVGGAELVGFALGVDVCGDLGNVAAFVPFAPVLFAAGEAEGVELVVVVGCFAGGVVFVLGAAGDFECALAGGAVFVLGAAASFWGTSTGGAASIELASGRVSLMFVAGGVGFDASEVTGLDSPDSGTIGRRTLMIFPSFLTLTILKAFGASGAVALSATFVLAGFVKVFGLPLTGCVFAGGGVAFGAAAVGAVAGAVVDSVTTFSAAGILVPEEAIATCSTCSEEHK